MIKTTVLIVSLILLTTQVNSAQNSADYYTHLKSEHREVLKKWLAKKTWLRPAIESDASKDDLEAWKRENKSFFPYYVVGDFNQDGKEDFAMILKVIKAEDEGVIVVFNAPFSSSKPAYFNRGFGVEQYYIEYMEDVKQLYFTKYETHGFYLKAKGGKYVRDKTSDKDY
jgi:hypothetical protein